MLLLSDATTETFKTIAQYIGIPATMMSVAIYAVYKGWFVPAPTIATIKEGHQRECSLFQIALVEKDKVISDRDKYCLEIKKEAIDRFELLRKEKDEWRAMALATSALATDATKTAGRALNATPPKDAENE